MRKFYFETEDYNGFIVTDGKYAYILEDFPADGTLEMAQSYDVSGIANSKNFEDISIALGTDLHSFDFDKNDYETLIDLGEL